MFLKNPLDYPKSILIETYSLCQGQCKFCPYQEIRAGKEQYKLDTDRFFSLINEIKLHDMKRVTLFNNNEPLLDDRIYGFIRYVRKCLPNTEITLSSNGRVVTLDKLNRLCDCGLNKLYISIPCVDRENYKTVMGVYPDELFNLLTSITDSRLIDMIAIATPITKYYNEKALNEKFSKYGIHSWNLEYKDSWRIKEKFNEIATEDAIAGLCDRPMDQAVVSANGDVIICCRDWQGQNVIGNIYESSLYAIWHSKKMLKIQEYIGNQEYDKVACCRDCYINRREYKR